MGAFSIWHWMVVLLIVALLFGTSRLRYLGRDLGEAVRGFRDSLRSAEPESATPALEATPTAAEARMRDGSEDRAQSS